MASVKELFRVAASITRFKLRACGQPDDGHIVRLAKMLGNKSLKKATALLNGKLVFTFEGIDAICH